MRVLKPTDKWTPKQAWSIPQTSASSDTPESIAVRKVHPNAYIKAFGSKKCVVIPNPMGMVKYRIIGPESYTNDGAWKECALRLNV